MKLIISATSREGALTLQVAHIVKRLYDELKEPCGILDLRDVPFSEMAASPYTKSAAASPALKPFTDQIAGAEALILVCPEYNGGIPGLIKHFIDHWRHPESFVYKPVCLIGLGGKFGALRPVEHLQNVFLYRLSFVFPIRVFIQNVQNILQDGELKDQNINDLLRQQARNFSRFVRALKTESFD